MKKTQKRVLGAFGVIGVAAITAFAISLPVPAAQAEPNTSVVDHLSVRVVNNVPDVIVTGLPDDQTTVEPQQQFTVTYNNVDKLTVNLQYTDPQGNVYNYPIDEFNADFQSGEKTYGLDLSSYGDGSELGQGKYTITIRGEGLEGVYDEQIVEFEYYSAYGEVIEDNDKYYLDVHYDYDDLSDSSTGTVAAVDVKIYYPGTNQEVPFSPISVPLNSSGSTRIELPFSKYGLDAGDYVIAIYAYDRDGNQLGSAPYSVIANYSLDEQNVEIPDTGSITGSNNISNADYLITGLLIFGITAVIGVAFILKNDKKQSRRRK